ncbi:MAG: ABC transporter permease [Beijerinckiaceae bacterium]|nr:ABC transporter permease [Beijerinckiaceae bacterium]
MDPQTNRSQRPGRASSANAPLRRDMPLVPADSIASRALVTVIAIMTFLASLTAGAAILVSDVSRDWRSEVAREVTIQIKPAQGRDLDQEARRAEAVARGIAGVADVKPYSRADSERLLEPWLGTGLDLGELPVPRLIVVKLSPDVTVDMAAFRAELTRTVPAAILDDHRLWLERLATMARTMVGLAIVIFLLVLIAMALAVAFATRGAMAGCREIVNVLHFVGAADSYIAAQFQRHFLWLGLRGGIIGGCAALVAFLLAGVLSDLWVASPGGEQIESLFGAFALGKAGYAAIVVIAGAVALLTGIMSRSIVFRHLQALD